MPLGKTIILYLIISLGVMTGNLLSTYFIAKAAAYALEKEARAMTIRMEEESRARAAQRAVQDERARQQAEATRRNTERQRQEAQARDQVQRQLNDTCNFWINEYNRSKTELHEAHRNVACRKAGRPFN